MSETVTTLRQVHRLTPLPETFWRGVMDAPWRYSC